MHTFTLKQIYDDITDIFLTFYKKIFQKHWPVGLLYSIKLLLCKHYPTALIYYLIEKTFTSSLTESKLLIILQPLAVNSLLTLFFCYDLQQVVFNVHLQEDIFKPGSFSFLLLFLPIPIQGFFWMNRTFMGLSQGLLQSI